MSPEFIRGRSTLFIVGVPLLIVAIATFLVSIQVSVYNTNRTATQLTQQQLHNNLQIVRSIINLKADHTNIDGLAHSLRTLPLQNGHGIALISMQGELLLNIGPADNKGIHREILPYLTFLDSSIHTLTSPQNTSIAVMRTGDIYLATYSRLAITHNHAMTWIHFSVLSALMFLALLITLHAGVTQPLGQMTQSLASILKRRRYDLRMPIAGSRELRSLAHSFNDLLEAVQTRDAQLRQHNQKLEQLVRARTAELEATHAELLRKEKMAAIGAFAASTVHELRNPLTAIRLSLDPLQKLENLDSKSQRRLTLIHEEASRLEDMLNDILNYAANRPLIQGDIDLAVFVKKYRPLLADTAKAYDAKLTIKSAEGSLKGDENRVLQILLNLVKNAAEVSPSVQLNIHSHKGRWHFEVSNKGHIDDVTVNRLFEPFFTTKKNGTGLGLSTCKKLAEDMKGTLSLTANDGKTVTLSLIL